MTNFAKGAPTLLQSRRFVPVLLALGVAACTARKPPAHTPDFRTRAEITPEDLRLRVGVLAHDSMQGRETGTPGALAAATYLAAEAARLGLQPAGDAGTFYHRVPLQRRTTMATVAAAGPAGDVRLAPGDVVPMFGGGLPVSSRTAGQGSLVYGGYLQDPTLPPGNELRPEQLAASVLILRSTAPGVDPATTPPRQALASAFAPGSPVAAVLLVAEGELSEFMDYARDLARKGQIGAAAPSQATNVPRVFLISPEAAERLVGVPLANARVPRADLGAFRYTVRETTEPAEAFNVVAVLPGSDSLRRRQYVALGSHYDHVGIGTPVNGDSIYNGADDDASGTAALIEIAERYAALPPEQRPARSMLFVWHTGEEEGLLGSEAFVARPTVPRDSIVAQFNIDMIGRNSPDSVSVVGSRRLSTELGNAVEEINRRQARPFALDYTLDAPDHPERIYCRSDHYSYAKHGIPIVFFTTGLHPDYHKPSDEADRLNYAKLAGVTRLVSDLAGSVASMPARPRVDQPVPPLGTPCQ